MSHALAFRLVFPDGALLKELPCRRNLFAAKNPQARNLKHVFTADDPRRHLRLSNAYTSSEDIGLSCETVRKVTSFFNFSKCHGWHLCFKIRAKRLPNDTVRRTSRLRPRRINNPSPLWRLVTSATAVSIANFFVGMLDEYETEGGNRNKAIVLPKP
jgi:hypothetical protein